MDDERAILGEKPVEEERATKDIRRNGYIATLRRARKGHRCGVCDLSIEPGQEYYEIVGAGGGLGGQKFPDRAHLGCLEKYITLRR